MENFWSNVNHIIERSETKKLIQNIARSKLSLKNDPRLKSWFELEARAEFSQQMFDQLAEGLYSLVIQKRQYGFYMKNLKLFAIPSATKHLAQPMNLNASNLSEPSNGNLPHAETTCDMRYYNELMNTLPAEYISTPVILHCMIEQVISNEEKLNVSSDSSMSKNSPRIQNLSTEVSNCLSNMISNLALEDKDKKVINKLYKNTKEKCLK